MRSPLKVSWLWAKLALMKKIRSLTLVSIILLVVTAISQPLWAEPKYGMAMHGDPASPADFKSLPYAKPQAPQGGVLKQAIFGTFDSIQP